MASSRYLVTEGLPSPQQYHDLRANVGMTPPTMQDVPKALANSVACYVVRDTSNRTAQDPTGDIVGMGRLIGDGAQFIDVVDIAVLPAHQKQGLGKQIMQKLVDWVDANAPNAYLALVGEPEAAEKLYPKFGFRDVAPSRGMYRCERVRLRKEALLKKWEEEHGKAP